MRVRDPDGVEWEVRRRWLELPRWRWRPRLEDGLQGFPLDVGEAGLVGAIVIVLLFALFFFVGLPLLVFLLALLVAVGGFVFRVLFGRPWLVEARSERGELAWRVRGTLGSRRAMRQIAAALARGERAVTPSGATRVLPDAILGGGRRR